MRRTQKDILSECVARMADRGILDKIDEPLMHDIADVIVWAINESYREGSQAALDIVREHSN